MNILITLALIAAGLFAALHIFREPLFEAAIKAQRGRAGLVKKQVRIDDHEVVYLEGGSGEPLVLIHGFGADKDNWIQIAPLLAPHFRLIIPDLPGFGETTRDPHKRYGAEEQIARLNEFVNSLGLKNIHIAGNSMGGFLAGAYAARFAENTKSLALLAPAGVESADPSEFFQCLERGDNPLLVSNVASFKRLIDFCFTKAPYVPGPFQRCLAERSVEAREFNEKVFGDLLANPLALESMLADSPVKTVIMWGDNDRVLHVSGAKILADLIPKAKLIIMDKMGHAPMLERPRETAQRYLDFHALT